MSVSDLLMLDRNSKQNATFRLQKVLQEKVRKEKVQLIMSLNVDHRCLHFLSKPMPLLPPCCRPIHPIWSTYLPLSDQIRSPENSAHRQPAAVQYNMLQHVLFVFNDMSCQVCQCVSLCNNLHSKMDVRVIFLWN